MSYVIRCATPVLADTLNHPQRVFNLFPPMGGGPDGHVGFLGYVWPANASELKTMDRYARIIIRKPSPAHVANVADVAADEFTIGSLEMGESYFLTWEAGQSTLQIIQNGTDVDQFRRQLFKFITVPSPISGAFAYMIQTRGDTAAGAPQYLFAVDPATAGAPVRSGIHRAPAADPTAFSNNRNIFVFCSDDAGPADIQPLLGSPAPNAILPRCYTLSCAASATPNALRLTLGPEAEGGALIKATTMPVYADDCFTFELVYSPGDAATVGHPTLGGKHLYNIRMFNGAYLSMYKYPGEAVWEFDYKYPSATAPLDIWELWEIRPSSTTPDGLFRIISPDHDRCIAVDPSGDNATSKSTDDVSGINYTLFAINMRPRNVPYYPVSAPHILDDELEAAPAAASAARVAAVATSKVSKRTRPVAL